MLAVFHDDGEARLEERDKISTHYLRTSRAFSEAMRDQVDPLEIGQEILKFTKEVKSGETIEAKIVKDADVLEAAVQAKVFHEGGFTIPQELLAKYQDEKRVETTSAKALMVALQQTKGLATCWWLGQLRI